MIPEIPYELNVVADHLLERRCRGSCFSTIVVAKEAISVEDAKAEAEQECETKIAKKKKKAKSSIIH